MSEPPASPTCSIVGPLKCFWAAKKRADYVSRMDGHGRRLPMLQRGVRGGLVTPESRSALFFADPGMDKFVHVIGRVPKTAICNPASSVASLHAAMAPHLTPAEQDAIFPANEAGKAVEQIWELVKKRRPRAGTPMVTITVLRRFIRGRTHKRGKVETLGRPRALSGRDVLTMDAARCNCVKETQGAHRVTWVGIIRKGRGSTHPPYHCSSRIRVRGPRRAAAPVEGETTAHTWGRGRA